MNKWHTLFKSLSRCVRAYNRLWCIEEIEAKCVWYLEIWDLIGKWLDQACVEIGNSENKIDMHILREEAESTE